MQTIKILIFLPLGGREISKGSDIAVGKDNIYSAKLSSSTKSRTHCTWSHGKSKQYNGVIYQMSCGIILTVLGIANCWLCWTNHPKGIALTEQSEADSAHTLLGHCHWLHRILGMCFHRVVKTCSRFRPNLAKRRVGLLLDCWTKNKRSISSRSQLGHLIRL